MLKYIVWLLICPLLGYFVLRLALAVCGIPNEISDRIGLFRKKLPVVYRAILEWVLILLIILFFVWFSKLEAARSEVIRSIFLDVIIVVIFGSIALLCIAASYGALSTSLEFIREFKKDKSFKGTLGNFILIIFMFLIYFSISIGLGYIFNNGLYRNFIE